MRQIDVYQVDAFTDVPFGGNPAGVVPDARGLTEEEMQKIAREMALSETAFVTPGARKDQFVVRFFTPTSEVDLCGHATIGTFFLLAELGLIRPVPGQAVTRVTQVTKAGELGVEVCWDSDGHPLRTMMEQNPPVILAEIRRVEEITEVAGMLGISTDEIGARDSFPAIVSTGLPDLIVPVKSRDILWRMRPDMNRVADWCRRHGAISVHPFATDPIDPAHTAHCRDFSPAVGIPEEAATGTASGATAGFMVLRGLVSAAPVAHMVLEQGHILGRPSTITCEVTTTPEGLRVRVGGPAVTVLSGRLRF